MSSILTFRTLTKNYYFFSHNFSSMKLREWYCGIVSREQCACLDLKWSSPNESIEFLPPSLIHQGHECKVPQDKCFLFLLKSRAGTIYHTWRQTQSNEENKADHSHATGLCIIHACKRLITPQLIPYCASCKIALASRRNITDS